MCEELTLISISLEQHSKQLAARTLSTTSLAQQTENYAVCVFFWFVHSHTKTNTTVGMVGQTNPLQPTQTYE